MNIESIAKIVAELKAYGNQTPSVSSDIELSVCIPARNEAQTIWKTLTALANQLSGDKAVPTQLYEVLVLCNNCNDDTVELCKVFQELNPEFPFYIYVTNNPANNNVGAARKVLMDLASERLTDNGFIIMTDADTIADKNWLHSFLKLQTEPVDLVCGQIIPDMKGLNTKAKKNLFENRHYLDLVSRLESEIYPQQSDPWPRHSHNSGPNMAVRNLVYKNIGGIPPIACLEDIALYQKVISSGYAVKHAMEPMVTTSCRSSSRVPGGFGSQIQNWSASKTENVEGYAKLRERFTAFAEIRQYYSQPFEELLNSIGHRLKIQKQMLRSLIEKHHSSNSLVIYLENFLEDHSPWNAAHPNINIAEAIHELEDHFSVFSQTSKIYSSARSELSSLKRSM
ncbi:glycosyl transferase family 2 [Gramella sp. Hel_I_59]|uniref:glycosyltransferase n=1 Tax=Gramella sp. Hel_I_59 TaxID=1249978 RepID=UPI0011510285|nr:glycosyltransferase family 2 protein [Gramella sp. Hel_I_59]TQI71415.1 glycosyl transferase family 2 [Gramella sp. Hel_I_59]